ncbi:MAG: N-acetylmuramoyl-L-alanine amidase [bacterium]|nr:N-acetylmuramoyl-L-alanine amidase [bacterium]
MFKRGSWVIILFGSFLTFSNQVFGDTVELTAMRFWTAPDHTRIVLDLTSEVKYDVFDLEKPPRIVIDLQNAKSRLKENELTINDGVIKGLRVFQFDARTLRMVLDLVERSNYIVFSLKRYRYSDTLYKPDRLAIDILKRRIEPEVPVLELKDIKTRNRIVVIDPGHGGEDPGAIGRSYGLKEKDVVLDISKRLKSLIDEREGVVAFLTRSGDYFVPLRKRMEIAKDYLADIFVSIHANANHNRLRNGTSVYVLSLRGATDEASRLLAEKENISDFIGGGLKVESDITAKILLDLAQTNTLNESLRLANITMDRLSMIGKTEREGVKRAGFVVLKSSNIPSILVETAYISNQREEELLGNSEFRQRVAEALADGICEYLGLQRPKIEIMEEKKVISESKYHVVKEGETLWRIAKAYGVSVEILKMVNRLRDSDTISTGQKLYIPFE